jgi:hypothetical protein
LNPQKETSAVGEKEKTDSAASKPKDTEAA